MKVKKIEGIEIKAEAKLGDLDLKAAKFRAAEMLVTLQSEVAGRTLKEAEFRAKYGLTVLAIYRHGQSLVESIGDVVLRVGDVLLVQGPEDRLAVARETSGLSMLETVQPTLYAPRRGLIAVGFFLVAIAASTAETRPDQRRVSQRGGRGGAFQVHHRRESVRVRGLAPDHPHRRHDRIWPGAERDEDRRTARRHGR